MEPTFGSRLVLVPTPEPGRGVLMNLFIGNAANAQPLAVAFVASILPDDELANYPAASRAGHMFKHGVLNALLAHGIDTSVISLRPVSSYPRSRQLVFRSTDQTFGDDIPCRQIGFINAGALKTLTVAFTSFFSILKWARQHRQARRVMLFYNVYNPSAWVGVVAGWLTRSKVIAIVADVRVPGSGGGDPSLLRRIEYQVATASLKHVDALVSVTRRIAADFAKGLPNLFLDGGVPDDMVAPLPLPASSKSRDKAAVAIGRECNMFVVLYAGNLTDLAGVPLLLQAFERIHDAGFRLWIIGEGELESVVRHAAAVDRRVQYLGKLSRQKLLETYAAADVLVNPHSTSLLTARYVFPSKLLEYLATGRPVITTATPEIAGDYGDLCTVLDREESGLLADAIMRLAATPKSERLAQAAKTRMLVIGQRAWSVQGHRLVRFLQQQDKVLSSDNEIEPPAASSLAS